MTVHTRLHVDNPDEIDENGKCRICEDAFLYGPEVTPNVGRLFDLDELLEQARNEVRAEIRDVMRAHTSELLDLQGATRAAQCVGDFVAALEKVVDR